MDEGRATFWAIIVIIIVWFLLKLGIGIVTWKLEMNAQDKKHEQAMQEIKEKYELEIQTAIETVKIYRGE